jgi:hypothetical protein
VARVAIRFRKDLPEFTITPAINVVKKFSLILPGKWHDFG